MSQQTNISFIILIGIPGSGKTTFSKYITEYFESSSRKHCSQHTLSYHVINVCYDELMPSPTYQCKDEGRWCEARKNVFNIVKALVSHLKGLPVTEDRGDISTQYNLSVLVDQTKLMEKKSRILIIIDDNMYYRSMRYRYFQLARACNVGFCQLYFQCELKKALQQNSVRSKDKIVPEDVIRKMANNIEFPDAIQHSWEEYSCGIPSQEPFNTVTLITLNNMIDTVFRNPPLPLQQSTEKESDRVLCSTSVLHQVDLSLRKIVRHEINRKRTGLGSEELQNIAKSLGIRKQLLFNSIKVGNVKIPEHISLAVEYNPSAGEQVYVFLLSFFNDMTASS